VRFEYVIVLIVLFNVANALWQRHQKKTRAEALRRQGETGAGGAADAARDARRATLPSAWDAEDEDEEREERGGDLRNPYRDGEAAAASPERRVGESRNREEPNREQRESVEMPSLGRDILDQIARDLGIRVPKPAPVPASGPVRSVPSAPAAKGNAARDNARELARANLAAERSTASRVRETPSVSDGTRRAAQASEAVRSRTASGAMPLRESLQGMDKLREALILKEILDLPLARRRR
jgi:hypothetical protein